MHKDQIQNSLFLFSAKSKRKISIHTEKIFYIYFRHKQVKFIFRKVLNTSHKKFSIFEWKNNF